jgi:hypothetical protein
MLKTIFKMVWKTIVKRADSQLIVCDYVSTTSVVRVIRTSKLGVQTPRYALFTQLFCQTLSTDFYSQFTSVNRSLIRRFHSTYNNHYEFIN